MDTLKAWLAAWLSPRPAARRRRHAEEDGGQIFDSPGDDLYVSEGNRAYISGPNHYRSISQTSNVYGYSVNGGTDEAMHFDLLGLDSFVASGSAYAYMSGRTGFDNPCFNVSVGFPVTYGYSSGGDYAYFLDSAGNDTFVSTDPYSYMTGNGFQNYAVGFYRIFGQSFVGGVDTAYNYAPQKTLLSGFNTVFTA